MRLRLRLPAILSLALLFLPSEAPGEPGGLYPSEFRIDYLSVEARRSPTTGLPPRWLLRMMARLAPQAGESFDPAAVDLGLSLDMAGENPYEMLALDIPPGAEGWRTSGSGRRWRWTSGPRTISGATAVLDIDGARGDLSLTVFPPLLPGMGEGGGGALLTNLDTLGWNPIRGPDIRAHLDLGGASMGGICTLREAGNGRWDHRRVRGRRSPESNEKRAVAGLLAIWKAQERLREGVYIDVDQDGVGEYGTLAELAGLTGVRAGLLPGDPVGADFSVRGAPLPRALLDPRLGGVDVLGFAIRDGYAFMVFLPGTESFWGFASEWGPPPAVFLTEPVAVDVSENAWCAYAQPTVSGETGFHRYFINQDGTVFESANDTARYQGTNTPITGYSAFTGIGITSPVADGEQGNDGDYWYPVR